MVPVRPIPPRQWTYAIPPPAMASSIASSAAPVTFRDAGVFMSRIGNRRCFAGAARWAYGFNRLRKVSPSSVRSMKWVTPAPVRARTFSLDASSSSSRGYSPASNRPGSTQ